MTLQSRVQQEVHGRVGTWLTELFGGAARPREGGAGYEVRFGSALAEVSVAALGEGEAVIVVRAAVVKGASVSAELMSHLLGRNCETRFGAFGVNAAGEIEYRHSILGSTCQKEEVKASVQYVMLVADLADDEIVKRWGGRRALD
jgi:hypothetical protein